MTYVGLVIGGHDVSDDVVRGRVTFEENAGVGSFELIILNESGEWLGDFEPHDAVELSVDSAVILKGYVDDTEPYIDPDYVAVDFIKVTGTDYGFDLQRNYITRNYPYYTGVTTITKDDDIIDNALALAGVEVTYTSASSGTATNYKFKRNYLSDGIKEIADERGKCFYVDQIKALHYFAKDEATEYLDGGDGRPNVDLILNSEDTNNNILDFREGEINGSKLYNYVELVAGPLMDHWTELNASDWTGGAGCSVEDAYSTELTDYLVGRAGIKIKRTAGDLGIISATLDIYNSGSERYDHDYIDLSKNDTFSVCTLWHGLVHSTADPRVRIILTDSSDRQIMFWRFVPIFSGANLHNNTDGMFYDQWYKIDMPMGSSVEIDTAVSPHNERWFSLETPATATFSWSQVKSITFTTHASQMKAVADGGGWILIDGLYIPTVEVKSIEQDATSIATYGKRMFTQQRNDIMSQVELDALSAATLPLKKDPLDTLSLIIIGNTNLKYPSQTVDVQATPKGIGSVTKYRITKLVHKFWSKSVRERMDRDYVTEVELVSQSADYDSLRRAWNADPYSAAIRQQRLGKTWADNVEGNQFSLLPNSSFPTYTSSGVISSGTTFPSSPAPNQIFLLTADSGSYIAGYYYYDTGLGDWVIQSVNFGYGASFPVSPTEGQLFYHTGWGYMFRYSLAGTEWVALDYDLDAVTGLTVDNDPTGLNNDSAATGLANNATGNHSHDTSYISGYVVENYTLLYAASVSGGSPTTSFYAPTTISGSEYCVVGTGVISGGGHNHTHGTDSHDTSHGTDSHDHSTNESNHIHDVIKTGDPP